jgi:hypothetical protein
MGVGHVLGQVVELDLSAVCAEVARRRRVLADAWPDPRTDTTRWCRPAGWRGSTSR